jgi:hypothetical protein
MKLKMGVTYLIFKLNNFKPKISAILNRHCCHNNGSCDSFFFEKIQLCSYYFSRRNFFVF